MTDLDRIKMEVEAARLEVVQAEKDISGIKVALRSVAAKVPRRGAPGGDDEDSSNSLLVSAIKVTGLPESATPSFHIQLSSPIEEKVITQLSDPLDPKKENSFAEFKGVETSVATLVVRAFDADILLGSSALYDVKPICNIDVLKGGFKKVSTLDIAIVPDEADEEDEGEVFLDAKSTVDEETGDEDEEQAGDVVADVDGDIAVEELKEEEAEEKEELMDETKDDVKVEASHDKTEKEESETVVEDGEKESEIAAEEEGKELATVAEEEEKESATSAVEEENESKITEEVEEKESAAAAEGEEDDGAKSVAAEENAPEPDAKTETASEEKSDETPPPAVEEGETEESTEVSDENGEGKEEENPTSASDSEQKDEEDGPSVTALLVPTCVVQMRIEYNPSIKDQKDELYDLLNKASKRKAMAVDKLRKSALAMNRASPAETSLVKKEKTVKSGFLNKKAVAKKEMFLVRWYNKALGRGSFVRNAFPIAKNYIIFFGGVALMHFQGQQLALPPPV